MATMLSHREFRWARRARPFFDSDMLSRWLDQVGSLIVLGSVVATMVFAVAQA